MQSYIGVLARSRVPLVDKKWSEIPKDIKEQIWEAVDMAFVVGQGGKNSVLSSAAKKWKDFKSTLTRHYILPYTNDKEKLSQPPETYKFIEKAQWDAFVASRLSKDFESVHSQHAQIREKLEYNHRFSRKGYAGLEDELEETMPGVEIDRSTLWKRARQDKHGNIPETKVAEKAKIIDELQKQVSEGKVSVYGSNDVLTMALGPEHPGRVRAVGSGISSRQYFNLPKPQRVSFDDRLKDSLRVLLQEETKKMEAKAREEALRMEARTKQLVEAEREHFLSQLSQLIPNFDPSMLKPRISQSPKNPMSDKASCSGGDGKHQEEEKKDTAKNGKHQEDEEKEEEKKEEEKEEEKEKEDEEKHDDKAIEVGDYSNMEAPSSLKTLCRYVETTLMPEEKILQFTIDKEVFGHEHDTFLLPEDITQFAGMEEIGATVVAVYMRYLHDVLKKANMTSMVGFIDPSTVSANSGTIADRSRLVAGRLQKTDGEQIFMMPYNPGLKEASWELTGFGFVGTPKLSELEARAIPGWVTTLGSCSVSSQKQNRAGSEGGPKRTISCYGGAGLGCDNLKEAFWELTGFGVVRTPKLSELGAGAIPGWVTTLGSCFVSSQKQNRAGSEGGPKRTISCYGGAGPGCDM
ncbi:hypothetical protein L3X38_012150 [Prunus dulcis]|uniref:Uncharacterized protein n=1 Tax=Prunus dulcis TaxID=3755 RepID=A0AAD4ZGC9_PRUDU|nr:hypothetical protein L3X38_012150 [Prunus dulcis]